eukprot:TRINITY_DN50726_c0_g1_i1.p2 TRINITY_DN50726_c0_g1~~TRINITY_DN50726_c0_g1_i1.p2  ORF type:complete len:148 (+),score=28.59 TRINITY_DN50726_c0_g1_i1:86-529(+)
MERLGFTYEFLWGCALGMAPLAICAWFLCGMFKEKPAARHALWMAALLSLVTPAVLVAIGVPRLPDIASGDEAGAQLGSVAMDFGEFESATSKADFAPVADASPNRTRGRTERADSRRGSTRASGPVWVAPPESPALLTKKEKQTKQ